MLSLPPAHLELQHLPQKATAQQMGRHGRHGDGSLVCVLFCKDPFKAVSPQGAMAFLALSPGRFYDKLGSEVFVETEVLLYAGSNCFYGSVYGGGSIQVAG